MSRKNVLIVEDEIVVRSSLKKFLEKKNYNVYEAGSVEEAVNQDLSRFCLIITDLKLPGPPGTDIISLVPNTPVLVMNCNPSLKSAVDTMKLGAADYIAKPFDYESLLSTIHELTNDPNEAAPGTNMLGTCDAMVELFSRINKVAPTNSTVLIIGESGTGKELVAKAIHNESAQSSRPMALLNCAAIPHTLIESELFGHEKGAFTGATNAHIGLVEAADGSTLFLDEIGELTLEAQARLLRVLQEGEVRRIGSVKTKRVSVRLIAATHCDLQTLVEDRQFREDLYYRLNVFKLELPPLRDRKDDLMLIADHVLKRAAKKFKTPGLAFTDQCRDVISRFNWPGNIRELENAIERAAILCDGCTLTPELLALEPSIPAQPYPITDTSPEEDNVSLEDYFLKFVLQHQDQMTETQLALKLGISRKSLWQKRQKLDIPRKSPRRR
jgi:DNA-binding NtrC family response regulator